MRRTHRGDDNSLPTSSLLPSTKIRSYCDKHRKLFGARRRLDYSHDESSYEENSPSYQKNGFGRRDEISVGYSDASSSVTRLSTLQSDSVVQQSTKFNSPQTSCLKTVTSRKTATFQKKVNFLDETTIAEADAYYSDHHEYDEICSETSEPTTFEDNSKSSSYYEPSQYKAFKNIAIVKQPLRSSPCGSVPSSTLRDASASGSSNFENYDLDSRLRKLRDWTETQEPFHRTISSRKADEVGRSSADGCTASSNSRTTSAIESPQVSRFSRRQRSRSHSRHINSTTEIPSTTTLNSEDQRLADQFERMSLRNSKVQQPKIVKARDSLKRAAVKRMLVYPPDGQVGAPLTLFKKWSNIDCRVRGDPKRGYKYKVYYLQEFESDRWFPDSKTGGPFRRIDDCTSTDYG